MKTEILIPKIDVEYAGEFISENYYLELVTNFRTKFPTEAHSVKILKSVIETVLADENVSGIKFMNGLENANDPSSRILVLIPANYTTSSNGLPNSVFRKTGFLTNTGNAISLERTWEVLFNHVLNYKKLDSSVHYTKINRGSFFGKQRIFEFLNSTNCENLIYNFGFEPDENLTYKPIIQPIDGSKMFLDQSWPCPGTQGCPDDGGTNGCLTTDLAKSFAGDESENQLSVLRSFRDTLLNTKLNGVEIEKYYSVSASLMEAINNDRNKNVIFKNLYDKYLKASVEHINQKNEANAYLLFTEVIDNLSNQYLFQ